MVTVQITDRMGDRPISLCYLDDNEKYTFNNGGNKGQGLKTLHVSR